MKGSSLFSVPLKKIVSCFCFMAAISYLPFNVNDNFKISFLQLPQSLFSTSSLSVWSLYFTLEAFLQYLVMFISFIFKVRPPWKCCVHQWGFSRGGLRWGWSGGDRIIWWKDLKCHACISFHLVVLSFPRQQSFPLLFISAWLLVLHIQTHENKDSKGWFEIPVNFVIWSLDRLDLGFPLSSTFLSA